LKAGLEINRQIPFENQTCVWFSNATSDPDQLALGHKYTNLKPDWSSIRTVTVLFYFQGENADERVKAAREAIVPGGNIKQFIEKDLAAKQHYLSVTKVRIFEQDRFNFSVAVVILVIMQITAGI
jgi:hypothetical protein